MTYIHELEAWPTFRWADDALTVQLAAVRNHQGRFIGAMEMLGFPLKNQAVLQTLTEDVLKSSEIEGEILDKEQVRSSLARRLGMDIGSLVPADPHVDGVVEMMLDATQNYAEPLTKKRLFAWHAALFPTGRSGMRKIAVGSWRQAGSDPMQVVSGPVGRERIHYQAPPARALRREMSAFLGWFERPASIDPVIKAAIAHLWFVTIHPFEDGNGRIARAIADMALARSEGSPRRFYSMSAQIQAERRTYYDVLERAQKGDLDVTTWLIWFLACLDGAIGGAEYVLATVLRRARFWDRLAGQTLNDRQHKMLNRLLDGFEGRLTSSKWAAIAKTSQDTAARDIDDLVKRHILVKNPAGGRSTSYSLIVTPADAILAVAASVRAQGRQAVRNDNLPTDEEHVSGSVHAEEAANQLEALAAQGDEATYPKFATILAKFARKGVHPEPQLVAATALTFQRGGRAP